MDENDDPPEPDERALSTSERMNGILYDAIVSTFDQQSLRELDRLRSNVRTAIFLFRIFSDDRLQIGVRLGIESSSRSGGKVLLADTESSLYLRDHRKAATIINALPKDIRYALSQSLLPFSRRALNEDTSAAVEEVSDTFCSSIAQGKMENIPPKKFFLPQQDTPKGAETFTKRLWELVRDECSTDTDRHIRRILSPKDTVKFFGIRRFTEQDIAFSLNVQNLRELEFPDTDLVTRTDGTTYPVKFHALLNGLDESDRSQFADIIRTKFPWHEEAREAADHLASLLEQGQLPDFQELRAEGGDEDSSDEKWDN